MPMKSIFLGLYGPIEVAANVHLRHSLLKGLRRWGPMTAVELANFGYWGRKPHDVRLGARWWSNASQQSATRRAIAALIDRGELRIVRKAGAINVYGLAQTAVGTDRQRRPATRANKVLA